MPRSDAAMKELFPSVSILHPILLYHIHTTPTPTACCQYTLTLMMSGDTGSPDARDTPYSDAISVTDSELKVDDGLLARMEAVFATKPSLRESRKVVDIKDRMNQLTPDVIREGEAEWIQYYWTMVSLVVPGEKTLINPKHKLVPIDGLEEVTEEWIATGTSVVTFLDYFFDPRKDMPDYNINDADFQQWLLRWRKAANLQSHAADEEQLHAVPTRDETIAYRNVQERHNINVETQYFAKTSLAYEVLIMWDFNTTAPEGEFTTPRISSHNIRFLLDISDAFPRGWTHLLKVHFVLKDIRRGRYAVDSSSKRRFDDNTRLGRSWQLIIRDAFQETRVLIDTLMADKEEGVDVAYLQAKTDLAEEVQRKIQRTWTGDDKWLNQGHLKFFMFDAFKESRRLRRKDPDIRRWQRQV
jgi:hypothetical protein